MLRLAGLLAVFVWSVAGFARTNASYLDLNLRQNRYLGGVQQTKQTSNYTLFAGDLNLETESEGFNYKLNPVAQGAFEAQDEFYFGVPEAYVSPRKIAPWFNLTIGRQKRTWSRLDQEFNLGLWQPQLRWDYLQPVQQGLTGVFFDWSLSSQVRFTFFTSPLHIPDQGPQFHLNNGQFESSNRWFEQPHNRLEFENSRTSKYAPLYFELDKPSEEELVMHSSFGLGLQYEISPVWFTQINYAYKPRNQIHIGLECSNCVNIGATQPMEVTAVIHPKIVKHHLVTWETGFERVDDRGWVSLSGDFPNQSGFPEDYQEAPLSSSLIGGLAYQHYLKGILGRPSWLQYSYMRSYELQSRRRHGLVNDDQVKSSLDRYPFTELAAIDWRVQLTQQKSSRWSWRNRYSYSFPERGGWLTTMLEWANGPMTWGLGADILGADVDPDSSDAGLFSTYRANDRVFGGVSYVF